MIGVIVSSFVNGVNHFYIYWYFFVKCNFFFRNRPPVIFV